ncbi:MAG: hypothetical protein Q9227_002792 [Pyrenula ochraceoflavens]
MPLHYADLSHTLSHLWTRENASLFDVSHMVQHEISGHGAEAFLMKITPSSLGDLPEMHSSLSCFLAEPNGGIVDDTVILRLGPERFHLVTNAGCRDSDKEFLRSELAKFSTETPAMKVDWEVLEGHSLFAFQGPKTAEILQPLVKTYRGSDTDLETLHFGQSRYLCLTLPDNSTSPPSMFTRTGYTGEDGFEISIPPSTTSNPSLPTQVAQALLSNPSTSRLAGLAARDSLRLEAGMCLYGHDLNPSTTPPSAALGWIVGKDRREPDSPLAQFNGSPTILSQIASPKTMEYRRVGLMIEKGPPAREGAEIVSLEEGKTEPLGRITSGLPSPSLNNANIAMGYVKNGQHKRGTKLGVRVRNNVRRAEVVKMPFVENRFYRG